MEKQSKQTTPPQKNLTRLTFMLTESAVMMTDIGS